MVAVPVKKSSSSASPSPSPTPSPSPSPTPSPSPPSKQEISEKLKQLRTNFSWEELNRLREMFEFFDTVISPMHKKYRIEPKITAYFLSELTSNALNIMINKSYQEAPRGLSIDSAISIIDEELPKIIEKSSKEGVSTENIEAVWDIIKRMARALK
jgi:hypothetical protein